MAPDPSFAGYDSHSERPLLVGPMPGEVGETFARVWFQARAKGEPGPPDVATYFRGVWRGGIDAGLLWNDGKACFFKGADYTRYALARDTADPGYPKPIASG